MRELLVCSDKRTLGCRHGPAVHQGRPAHRHQRQEGYGPRWTCHLAILLGSSPAMLAWLGVCLRQGPATGAGCTSLGRTWHVVPMAAEALKLLLSMNVGVVLLEPACAGACRPGLSLPSLCETCVADTSPNNVMATARAIMQVPEHAGKSEHRRDAGTAGGFFGDCNYLSVMYDS